MKSALASSTVGLIILTGGAVSPATAAGPHEHGVGSLAIAIEGTSVQIELEVPGDDIVGFEHAARTKAQKAAVASAKDRLAKPLSLFVPPAAAGCKVASTNVMFETKEANHAEFHATYKLDCADVSAFTTVDFPFFKSFKGAGRLAVTVVGPQGQTQGQVSRSKPRMAISGGN